MNHYAERLTYTFEDIFNETIGSHDDGDEYVDTQVLLSYVKDDGLNKFINYCEENNIKYSIEYEGDNGVNLRVFR